MIKEIEHNVRSGYHSFVFETDNIKSIKEIDSWCIDRFSLDYTITRIHYPVFESKTIQFTLLITNNDSAQNFSDNCELYLTREILNRNHK